MPLHAHKFVIIGEKAKNDTRAINQALLCSMLRRTGFGGCRMRRRRVGKGKGVCSVWVSYPPAWKGASVCSIDP